MFPLDHKMAGSGSCCENQLLLQKHISMEHHVGLWRSHCLQSSASRTARFVFYPCRFSVVDHALSLQELGLIDSAEPQCFCNIFHCVNTNPAPVTLQQLRPPAALHCTIKAENSLFHFSFSYYFVQVHKSDSLVSFPRR